MFQFCSQILQLPQHFSLSVGKKAAGVMGREKGSLICKGFHFDYLHLPNVFLMKNVSRQLTS